MRKRDGLDYTLLSLVLILVVFGFVALSSASSDLGKARFDDPYYYTRHQVAYGLTLGLIGLLFGMFFPYEKYRKFAPLILFLAISLVILTFTPLGFSSGGATRWLNIGPLSMQPAEILKFAFILYAAAWLAGGEKNRQKDFVNGFLPFIIVCGLVLGLLILQKSTSSLVITMAGIVAVYFASGVNLKHLYYLLGIGVASVLVLILLSPYRIERVMTFISPGIDEKGSGYQVTQALNAIGSGGLTGLGYGNSIVKTYLPERIGDSIFAVIAEEFGFIGANSIVIIFLFIALKTYMASAKIRDQFGKLLLVGFGTIIAMQAFMHIAAISGLIPLTGVPLPFISYGGTALAIFMTASGVMLNIIKRG